MSQAPEIRDYLASFGRARYLLVLLPLLAGGLTLFVLGRQPPQYVGAVEVDIPRGPEGSSGGDVVQYVADFNQVVRSPQVSATAIERSGIDAQDYETGLETEQRGDANRLEVSHTSTRMDAARQVPALVAALGLEALSVPELRAAEAEVAAATAQYEEARSALDAFSAETGVVQPETAYEVKLIQLDQLRIDLEQSAPVGGIERSIRQREAELARLQEDLTRYLPLQDRLSVSSAVLTTTTNRLNEARARAAQARSPLQITPLGVAQLPRAATTARAVGIAAGLALAFAIAVLLLADLLRSQRPAPAGTLP